MDILDEVDKFVVYRGGQCTVGVWLVDNPDYTSEDLRRAAKSKGQSALLRFLKDKGFGGGPSTLSRHILGECKCL